MAKNRRKIIIFFILLVWALGLLVFLYLNRTYSHIYDTIAMANLKSVDKERVYSLGNQDSTEKAVYVALGDSLSSGVGTDTYNESYPYLLATQLSLESKQVSLIDYSVPGARTLGLLNGLLPSAISENPDIVTLLIGVNDVHNKISETEFEKEYAQILQRLAQETKARVYAINIPYIGSKSLILFPHNYVFDIRTKRFNKIIKKLSEEFKIQYIDLYTPTESLFKQDGPHYSRDLFHPSAVGYKIWAEIIYDGINK